MDTREIAAKYRITQWAQIIQARKDSSLSIEQYCKDTGVTENAYYYWQRKIRRTVCEQLINGSSNTQRTGIAMPDFTKVIIDESSSLQKRTENYGPSQMGIEINGIRITTDSGYPPEKLAVLIRELIRP